MTILDRNAALAALAAAMMAAGAAPAAGQATVPPGDATPGQAVTPADADPDALTDIVVLARKRAENVQDVPISITAIAGDELLSRNVVRVQDLVQTVPNMTSDGGGSVLGAFGLRGIVSQTRNIGFDSGLGVYTDGVLSVRPNGSDQELPDIASVEVLRGPQGTLFGRNTTAGAVNITTRSADLKEFGFDGRVAVGNLDLIESSAFLTGPVVKDRLAVKVSGSVARRDGYLRNLVDGRDYNGVSRQSVRGGVLWTPGATLDVALNGNFAHQRDSLVVAQVARADTGNFGGTPGRVLPGFFADPYTIAQDGTNAQQRRIWGTDLHLDLRMGDYTLTSISAYGENRSRNRSDDDSRPFPVSASDFRDGADQFTQELRLASPTSGSFDYLVGLFYLWQGASSNRATTITAGPSVGFIRSVSSLSTNGYAAFASANWRLTDRIVLAGGLRYNRETKTLDFRQTNSSILPLPALDARLDRSDSDVSGNASINFEVVRDTRLYASVARGFKSGGYNPDIVGSTDIGFGPEGVWSYEAGLKSELLDRRVRVNAAAFYSDYSDLQVSALSGVAFQIRNAGKARIKGGELEITARPVLFLDLNFGLGYTDAKYTEFPGCAVSVGGTSVDCRGNRLPFVPEWTLTGGAQLNIPVGAGELTVRGDVNYRSDTFYEAFNAADGRLPGYALVNARIGYQAPDRLWGIAAFARNAFDKRYRDFSFYFAPFDQRGVRFAAPRIYGIELTTRL